MPGRRVLAVCCLLLVVAGASPVESDAAVRARRATLQTSTKEADFARLVELDAAITDLRGRLAANPTSTRISSKLTAAVAEYDAVSARLGGDRAPLLATYPSAPAEVPLGTNFPPPPNCTPVSGTFASGAVNVPIPDGNAGVSSSTVAVAGMGPFLLDVDVTINVPHTWSNDLDMTLTSPSGTVVTLTTDNGSSNDNVFAGTTFDDDSNPAGQVPYTTNNGMVTDHAYLNLTVATPLTPEEPLATFFGEDPNGTWTLRAVDDVGGDIGTIVSWSLAMTALTAPPGVLNFTGSSGTVNLPIPDGSGVPAVSTIAIAGAGTYICDVDVTVTIPHTWSNDLDVTLTSPTGTVVTLTSDNGSDFIDVYEGTTFDDDANPAGQVPYTTNNGMVTEHSYSDFVTATPLTPEEGLGAFISEDPNGTWTLRATDDTGADTGTLVSWSLDIDTCACTQISLCNLTCPGDITTQATDLNGAVVTFAPTASNCINVVCVPPSGSTFPVGTTVVTCTGEDDVPGRPGAIITSTYSSGNLAVPIPDPGSIPPQVITVADAGTVTDVDVRVRVNHTWDSDLDISLTGPNAVTIDLSSDNGGGSDNYGSGNADCSGTPTVFDDEAGTPIASGTAPFAGSYIPEQALSAFDGIPAAGNWTLNIADDLGVDAGTLFCYEIVITRDTGNGGSSTCQFNVTVTIPFDGCCIDDYSGDIFRQVVASVPSTDPLYGYWEYEVAATGEIFSGIANHVAYRPGLSIIVDDNDDPAAYCHAEIDFPRNRCRVQVRDIPTGRNFVLRDRNLNNNVCTEVESKR